MEVRYSFDKQPNRVEHVNNYFTSNNYIGYVVGHPRSTVTCYIEQITNDRTNISYSNFTLKYPLIYAQIRLENNEPEKNEYFYIEPIFISHTELPDKMKYIIYKTIDIESDVISNGVFK